MSVSMHGLQLLVDNRPTNTIELTTCSQFGGKTRTLRLNQYESKSWESSSSLSVRIQYYMML
jgi:hypothetical protein